MSRRRHRYRASLLVLLASVAATTAARAEPSKEDVEKADTLFRDAQLLVQKGQYAEACEKFAESQELDPANGTLLNLGVCHEKEGKTATAYRVLQELLVVLGGSKNPDDRERARLANERLKVLEKKLSRVSFDVSALPSGATLTLDGEPVHDPASPILVDPGEHTVEATAPDKKPGQKTFDVREPGTTTVAIDPLEDAAPPPPPPEPEPPEPEPPPPKPSFWTGQRIAGAIVTGVGLAGIGVGTYYGLDTFSLRDQRDPSCNGTVCTARGMYFHEKAQQSATISSIAFGVGAGAVVLGAILFVTGSPKAATTTGARTAPQLGVGPRGFVLSGAF